MGNYCGVDSVRQVTSMTNRPRIGPEFQKVMIESQRFGEVLFTRKKQTTYNFILRVRHDGAYSQINVDLVVLKQIVDMVLFPNFDLLLFGKPIIDIFDMADHTQVFIPATNKRNKQPYSVKIYPFESYDSYIFKKGLYQIFLHNLLGPYSRGIVNLQDYFVLDRSEQKALILLFEPIETNLSNIIQLKNRAGEGWSELEQLYIMRNILAGYETLNQKNIYHRDLRPGKIYYSKLKKQYLIGNLQSARIVMAVDLQRDALLTPRGVPFFNSQNVNDIIKRGDRVGHYNALQNDYIFLKKLMLYLNNCSFEDTHQTISHPTLLSVYQKLNTMQPIQFVIAPIRQFDYKIDDIYIAQRVTTHLAQTNSKVNKTILLNGLFMLRQDEEYSRMAHAEIEANIQNGDQEENAKIFLRLGQYYASNNANSEDYFINALKLFVDQSKKNRKMGKIHQCIGLMRDAKTCNDYILDFNYKIMYLGEVAIVRAALGYILEANQIMTEALKEAATRGIPPKQELELLLAKGQVCCLTGTVDQCQKYLKFALTICDDRQYFEDIRQQNGYKARIMKILGVSYVGQSLTKDQFLVMVSHGLNDRTLRHLNKAQSYLVSALQLSQLSISEPVQLASINLTLGQCFMLRGDVYQAKKSFVRSVQYYLASGQDLNPILLANAFKQLATSQMIIGQLLESQKSFISAYRIYNSQPNHQLQSLLTQGYLGVVMIMQGRLAEGQQQANIALQALSQIAPGNPSVQMLTMEKMQRQNQARAITMTTNPMKFTAVKAPVTYSAMPNPIPDQPMLPPPPSAASAATPIVTSGLGTSVVAVAPAPVMPIMPVAPAFTPMPVIAPTMPAFSMAPPIVPQNPMLGGSMIVQEPFIQPNGSRVFNHVQPMMMPPAMPVMPPPMDQNQNIMNMAVQGMTQQMNTSMPQPSLVESRVNQAFHVQHAPALGGSRVNALYQPQTSNLSQQNYQPQPMDIGNSGQLPLARPQVSIISDFGNQPSTQMNQNIQINDVNTSNFGQQQIPPNFSRISNNSGGLRSGQITDGMPNQAAFPPMPSSNLRNTRPLNSNGALTSSGQIGF